MTDTPPKIDKYGTRKKWCLTKMAYRAKKNAQRSFAKGWIEWFYKGNFEICSRIQTHGHGILKSSFSSLCLIVRVGIISRVLVVLQKTNNISFEVLFLWDAVFVRCHLCWVLFLWGGIFDKRSALFVVLCQWVP